MAAPYPSGFGPNVPAQPPVRSAQPDAGNGKGRGRSKGFDAAILTLKVVIVVCVIIFVFLYNEKIMIYLQAGLTPYEELPESVDIIVERVLSIDVEQAGAHYNLTIPMPKDVTVGGKKVQEIRKISTNPLYQSLETRGEDTYMVWSGDISPGQKVEIRIRYEFTARSVKWDITSGKSGTVSMIPAEEVAKFCKNEWPVVDRNGDVIDADQNGLPDSYRIEPENPVIKERAEQWTKGTNNVVYNMAKAIFDKMRENFVYVRGAAGAWPQSAMESLMTMSDGEDLVNGMDKGKGDCDDQSILFISLCRALNIPAWLESGALYNKPTDQWEGHAWVDVLVPLQNGEVRVATVDVVNNLFFIRDTDRLSEWVDDGNQTRLSEYYTQWRYSYTGSIRPELTTDEQYHTIQYDPHARKTQIMI